MNSQDFKLIQNIHRFCKEIWNGIDFKIHDVRETSQIYKISSGRKKFFLEVDKVYTKDKRKKSQKKY